MSGDLPDPSDDDPEPATAEENLGAPQLDPRVAELSAAEEYSRPRPRGLSDVHVHAVIVDTPDADE